MNLNIIFRDPLRDAILENNPLKEMQKRMTRNFLDIIILTILRSMQQLNGYELVERIHQKFGVLVSAGTVYNLLYSMERKGLLKGEWTEKKRTYVLTDEGRSAIDAILSSKEETLRFMRVLFADC